MLLRRIVEHVKTQNWTAIMIDFLIVIGGVFIGVQLSNWNDVRQNEREYEAALMRYESEIKTNLMTLDSIEDGVLDSLRIVGAAIDALQTCNDSENNRALIEAGIQKSMGTLGLSLRTNALQDLTESADLLAQQSEEERKRFQETRYLVDVFLREAEFVELIPHNERLQNNPMVKLGPPKKRDVSYIGVDYSRPERTLLLAAPVDEACADNMLASSLYTWERWQGALPAIIRVIRDALQKEQANLDTD